MSIIDINADACEAALQPKCVCPCGGKMHGVKHTPEWRAEQEAARIDPNAPLDFEVDDGSGQLSLHSRLAR